MDLGLYYLGIVSQPFKYGAKALAIPPFSPAVSTPVHRFMRFYNRRFAAIARVRRERRKWGEANSAEQYLFQSFSISPKDLPRVAAAAAQWLLLELREGWRSWFGSAPSSEPLPRTAAPARGGTAKAIGA
jgi:hypothetical protein